MLFSCKMDSNSRDIVRVSKPSHSMSSYRALKNQSHPYDPSNFSTRSRVTPVFTVSETMNPSSSMMRRSAFHPVHPLSPGFFHIDPSHSIVPAASGPMHGAGAVFSQRPLIYEPGIPIISQFHPYIHRFSNVPIIGTPRVESREHHIDEGPKKCPVCGKSYARPSTLRLHLRTHSGEKPYQCLVCLKSFTQAANLTAHFRIHSGEKPFKCHICSRQFSQSSSVTTHMRTHNGERPYRCEICTKAFADSSTLTKHMRTHTGEKPYQCDICHQRFSQSGNLNRHKRIHSEI